MEHGTLAVVVGEIEPVVGVFYDPDEKDPDDSGFTIVLDDAPSETMPEPDQVSTVCLHCAINNWPEIGRALDLARQHEAAELIDGEWVSDGA